MAAGNISVREIGINIDIDARFRENDLLRAGVVAEIPLADYAGLRDMHRNGLSCDMAENTFGRRSVAIRINGVDFYTLANIGNPGGSGSAISLCTQDGTQYCMKRQIVREGNIEEEKTIIKEAIIGHALYKKTSAGGYFETGPVCTKIFYLVKGAQRVTVEGQGNRLHVAYYMLMEKGSRTFGEYLESSDLHAGNFRTYVMRLAQWLQYLNENYGYIHADFKSNNILMDESNHIRLIDFGWNKMTINDVVIKARNDVQYTDWRDFTLLSNEQRLYSIRVKANPNNNALIQNILEGATFQNNRRWGTMWSNRVRWEDTYTFLNNINTINPHGTATYVRNFLHRMGIVAEASIAAASPQNPFAVAAVPVAAAAGPNPRLNLSPSAYADPISLQETPLLRAMENAILAFVDHAGPGRPDPTGQVSAWLNLFVPHNSTIRAAAITDGILTLYRETTNTLIEQMANGENHRETLQTLKDTMQAIRALYLNAAPAARVPNAPPAAAGPRAVAVARRRPACREVAQAAARAGHVAAQLAPVAAVGGVAYGGYIVLAAIPGWGWGCLAVAGLGAAVMGCGDEQYGGRKRKTRKASRSKNQRKTRHVGGRAAAMTAPANVPGINIGMTSVPSKSIQTSSQQKSNAIILNKQKANIVPAFDYTPTYSYDRFLYGSVERLFHYLRFDALPSVSEKDKKDLFKKLAYVKCKDESILKEILSLAETQDLQQLQSLAERNKVSTKEILEHAKSLLGSDIELKPFKTIETIIDGWFLESNSFLAYGLLRRLLFSVNDDKYLVEFLEKYASFAPEERKELVIYEMHNAFII
jgi:serine/threonine protein kinase